MPSIRLPENKGPKKTSRELVVGEGRKITLTTISLTSLKCQSFKQQIAAIAEKLPDGEVVTQDDSGSIARFRLEWNRYFTRSYYRKFLTSDAKSVKGHLVFGSAA